MSQFLTALAGEWIDDERFELLKPLRYQSDILLKEFPTIKDGILEIVDGFVTDFASVPRVPIVYELFGDKAHHESVPHDFMYQTHVVPKSVADRVFLEAMAVRGKPPYIRYPMYWGVVLGGQSSYDSGPSRYLVLNDALSKGGTQ